MNDEQFKKLQAQRARKRKPTTGNFDNCFYSLPDSKLITILIVIAIIFVTVFLIAFRYVTKDGYLSDTTNGFVGSYLGIVAIPVGVILSFIVASVWAAFSDAQAKENEEATNLLLLYNIVKQLPKTAELQLAIKRYTAFIIEVEFPLMEQAMQSQEGLTMIITIGDMIYEYQPESKKDIVLYREAITMYESIISLRIIRLGYTINGLAPELWWVLILGVVVVIIVSFFIYSGSIILQLILTILITTALVSMLFVIVTLNFPYRGDFSLDSMPFEIALANMLRPTTTTSMTNNRHNKTTTNTTNITNSTTINTTDRTNTPTDIIANIQETEENESISSDKDDTISDTTE